MTQASHVQSSSVHLELKFVKRPEMPSTYYEYTIKARPPRHKYLPGSRKVEKATVIARTKMSAILQYQAGHPKMVVVSCERGKVVEAPVHRA